MPFSLTRIAPTPSGFLHIGNALSFAITAALAEQHGAGILLRIDDMDRERLQPEYVEDIFDTLNFLNIPWNKGPRNFTEYQQQYSQIHRLPLYNDALQQLKDHVFACDCSRSRIGGNAYPMTCLHKNIPLDAPDVAWRLQTTDSPVAIHTLEGVFTATLPAEMKYFIVRKKNGFPAYQLSSVIDDQFFGVDLVVRGEDLRASTLAQLYLADVLGISSFKTTTFYHHPLILESKDQKLSKSAGSTSIQYLRKEGRTAADVFGMISEALGFPERATNYREIGELILKK